MSDEILEPVMLSALQHCLFCPRQFALIHIEGVWRENFLTAAGRLLHERVDRTGAETRRDVHIATALQLASRRLGLVGVADRVEFHRIETPIDAEGHRIATQLNERPGWWRPYPVEYKRGKPKSHRADDVQLCAQALCLEEMLNVFIPKGALFYGETRRRQTVHFNQGLRKLTEQTAVLARDLIKRGKIPAAVYAESCEACSIKELCRPKNIGESARIWLNGEIDHVCQTR